MKQVNVYRVQLSYRETGETGVFSMDLDVAARDVPSATKKAGQVAKEEFGAKVVKFDACELKISEVYL